MRLQLVHIGVETSPLSLEEEFIINFPLKYWLEYHMVAYYLYVRSSSVVDNVIQ